MKKKLLPTILAVAMVLSLLPVAALAAYPDPAPDEGERINIENSADLVKAIENQKAGQTWILAAGEYDVTSGEENFGGYMLPDDVTINNNKGPFAFPIYVNDLTIKAAPGAEVTITSNYVTTDGGANHGGDWHNQNFITVKGIGVTIEGVDLKGNPNDCYGGACNKVIELIDGAKDFTLKDVELLPLTTKDGITSGSVYISVEDAGETVIDNVTMYSWIRARDVQSGTVTVTNLTQDFRDNAYAGYYSDTDGYAWNPGVSGACDGITTENFTILVDDSIDLNGQIFNADQRPGVTVELDAGEYAGPVQIKKDATLVGNGDVVITFDDSAEFEAVEGTAGIVTVNGGDVTLENITIQGNPEAATKNTTLTHDAKYAGLVVLGGDVTMDGCSIKNVTYDGHMKGMQNGFGIYAEAGESNTLTLIDTDISNFNKAGIVARANTDLEMDGCTVAGMGETDVIGQNGIQYAGSATIKNSEIKDIKYNADNEWSGGACAILNVATDSAATTVIDNVTTENVDYTIATYGGSTEIKGGSFDGLVYGAENALTITGGSFADEEIGDYLPEGSKPVEDENGNWTVGPAEDAAAMIGQVGYDTVQAAIDAADSGAEVVICKGIHNEILSVNKNIKLIGEDGAEIQNITVIGTPSKLDTVTIENLKIFGASNKLSADVSNAGIYLYNIDTAVISNCEFDLSPYAVVTGGPTGNDNGLKSDCNIAVCTGEVGKLTVENCTVDGYTMAGYHNPSASTEQDITYEGNTIKNAASGIGFIATDKVTVTGNTFENSNGIRLDPDWNESPNTCGDVEISNNKFLSVSPDGTYGQYAIRTATSNGTPGYTGTLELDHNYWGSKNPNFGALIQTGEGQEITIKQEPYYVDKDLSQLNTESPTGGGTYVPTYTNTVEKPEHGAVTVSPKNASKGQTVTITVTPDKGYELDWLFVTDKNGDELALTDKGNGKFTFKMPASKVSIEAWFTETAPVVVENPYVDVFESDYYYYEVLYAYENGLMVGNGDTFAPKASFDRKQLAMLLWNMEGKPVVNYAMSFNDVPAGQWYTEAIRWAASTGVMTGYGADTFGTDDLLTRQQMATAFFRYAEAKAEKGNLNDFTDGAQVADWAADGMVWAVNHGLFQGYNNCLTPGATANRAQVAIILYRYCENIA